MKIITVLYFFICCFQVAALAQSGQSIPEEYAYYRNGKKVVLTAKQDEIFVTFASKVSLAKSKTYSSKLLNEVAAPQQNDVFAPINAVRYRVKAGPAGLSGSFQQVEKQLKNNPDVITAYPAFMIGKEVVYVSNKLHFSMKKGADLVQIKAFLRNNNAAIIEEINLGDRIQYVVAVRKGGRVFDTANRLFESGQVEFADPDFTFTAQNHYVPNDSFLSKQWFLHQDSDADIDAPEAWSMTFGAYSVTVAVIDGNGYDLSHEDMKGKYVNPYDAVNNDNDPSPENVSANHGTPCAGLIGATTNNTIGVAGVGFNIKVMPVCIGFDAAGNTFKSNTNIITRAASKVITAPGVVAVSNSFGLNAELGTAVQEIYTAMRVNSRQGLGAVILASTMNDGRNSPTIYPASYPEVVGVGASTETDKRADFSNYGGLVDIVAPGENTYTIDRTGTSGYNNTNYTDFTGTSAACPIAAGVVGLMASINPTANWATLTDALIRSADKVGEKAGEYKYFIAAGHPYGTWNNEMGHGRVNAYQALLAIQGPPMISAFEPAGGPVGSSVTITGKNFLGASSVTFNGVPAQFTIVNATTIIATSPSANTGPIRVNNALATGKSGNNWLLSAYCIPAIENPCSSGDFIDKFSLYTLFNYNSGCNGQTANYLNHDPAVKSTVLQKGQSYTIQLQGGPNLSQGFGVWIDYNNDNDFSDSGEFVYASPAAGKDVFTGTITVPATVSAGQKRVRVRNKYFAVPTAGEWCAKYTTGETEDYTITIGYCIPQASCQQGDYINNFSFNTLVNNNTGCNMEGASVNGYINHPPSGTLTTTVSRGKSYSLKMQAGSFPQGFGVWIDFNNDSDFEDSGEFVYGSSVPTTSLLTTSITIPATVSIGQRRMRVRSEFNGTFTANESCSQVTSGGETEDYTITINEGVGTPSQWNRRFGGSGSDNFSVVIRTSDGGYLLGGHSTSAISGDRTQGSQGAQDYWIVKIDALGNKQWDKRFGGLGADYLNALVRTSDGGYLLGGNSLSGISGDKSQASQGGQDYWVVKISSTGTKQWDKRFGGTGNDDLRTLHQLSTGEYILAGYSASGISGDKSQASQGLTDYWVVKISSTGSKIWDKRFGGTGDDWLEASVVNADGSMVLAGRSASGISGDKTQASQGGRDFWVVKISSTGSKLWDKRFGGTANDEAYAMVATSDGYLIGGTSSSSVSGDKSQSSQGGNDYWLIRINSSGGKVWDKRFGGTATDEMRSLIATTDGGFLLGGRSDSGMSGDKSQASQGGQDYWAVKISSTGTKQWDKRFGGSSAEELRTVLQTSDGGYLFAGRSDSGISGDKTQPSQGGTDYWLVKIPSALASLRTAAEQLQEEQAIQANVDLQTFPNPFTEKLAISFTLPQTGQAHLKVYNSQGMEVTTLFEGEAQQDKTYVFDWNAADQMPGIYIIRLGTSGTVSHKKVVLVK